MADSHTYIYDKIDLSGRSIPISRFLEEQAPIVMRKVIKTSRPGLVFLFYYCFQSVLNLGNKICQIKQLALSCNSVQKADTVDCTRPTRPVKGLFFIKMNPNTWPKKITRPRPVLLSGCTRVVSKAAVAE